MTRLLLLAVLFVLLQNGQAALPDPKWDQLIQKASSFKNQDELTHYLEAQENGYTVNDKKIFQTIRLALIAENERSKVDSLNPKSTSLYLQALQNGEQLNNEDLLIWINTQIGFYYYRYMEYVQAMPYFLRASHILNTQPLIGKGIQRVDVRKKNAYYFTSIGYTEHGLHLLKDAYKIADPNTLDYAEITFSLGIENYKQGNLDDAKHYFFVSQETALQLKDTVRYAKVLGELAYIAMDESNFEEAIKLLKEDIAFSRTDERNSTYAKIALAKALNHTNRLSEAKTNLQQAKVYLSSKPYLKDFYYQASEIELEIAKKEKNTQAELLTYRTMDSLHHIISTEKMQQANTQVHLQLEAQKLQGQLEYQQKELNRETFMKRTYISIIILLLILVLVVALLYRARIRTRQLETEKQIANLQLAMIASEEKLSKAKHSLQAHQAYIVERDNAISELNKLKNQMDSLYKNSMSNTTNFKELLTSHLMTEENWNLFKQAFIKEERTYYEYILYMFPDITESNLRLMLLLKINLKNAQIANLLGITVDAVKKHKQRLRKKYGDDFDKIFELNNFE